MCPPDKPFENMQDDGIVQNSAKQRAWRAAKMRQLIENQTPSEIMEKQTGDSVPRFGIDGLETLSAPVPFATAEQIATPEQITGQASFTGPAQFIAPLQIENLPHFDNDEPPHIQDQVARVFSQDDIISLARVITEEVFLLPEYGLIFTRQQLAAELGVTPAAMEAMTDEGYQRLGLTRIVPQSQ
jgi:hypothetical protein